jgi:hypothetical protein
MVLKMDYNNPVVQSKQRQSRFGQMTREMYYGRQESKGQREEKEKTGQQERKAETGACLWIG